MGADGLLERARELIHDSVELADTARKEAGSEETLIAASITTLEWCFRPDKTPDVDQIYDEYVEELTDYADAARTSFCSRLLILHRKGKSPLRRRRMWESRPGLPSSPTKMENC